MSNLECRSQLSFSSESRRSRRILINLLVSKRLWIWILFLFFFSPESELILILEIFLLLLLFLFFCNSLIVKVDADLGIVLEDWELIGNGWASIKLSNGVRSERRF